MLCHCMYFKVCTNTCIYPVPHYKDILIIKCSSSDLQDISPNMLVKDSHLKDYDKINVQSVICTYTYSNCVFPYHSLTLIVQLVLDCHTPVLRLDQFSIVCLLGCDDEEPTPSLCLRSMVALIEYAMCGRLIYPIVSTYRVHK